MFYNKDQRQPRLVKPADLTAVYQRKASEPAHPHIEEAFAEYYDAVQFDLIQDYDPYDMLYWEHRMGTWHSNVVMETDPGFQTHIVFNSRRILTEVLSLSHADRRSGAAFTKAIELCWPELNNIPTNPKNWQKLVKEPPTSTDDPRQLWRRLARRSRPVKAG